jgi:hypothetical protein
MATVFNGQVTGVSKIATGTPAALCREANGTMEVVSHDPEVAGAGGQWWTRKGSYEVTVSLTCVGVALADQQKFFPTTAGVQVASFWDLLVEADDGTNGREFVLSDGQPGSIRIAVSEALDGYIACELMMKYATVTPANIGTDAPAYNSLLGHTINDVTIQRASTDADIKSMELAHDLNLQPYNPMNTKSAGSKTAIDGWYIDPQGPPTFSCVAGDLLWGEDAGDPLFGDTWTASSWTIALANGTAGENITYTLTNYTPRRWSFGVGADHDGFPHELKAAAGTVFNRCTLA